MTNDEMETPQETRRTDNAVSDRESKQRGEKRVLLQPMDFNTPRKRFLLTRKSVRSDSLKA
jgi:hypothetical protein